MTPDTKTADRIERYLLRFRLALSGVAKSDKEDLVSEIRSHIVERLDDTSRPLDELVEQTLALWAHQKCWPRVTTQKVCCNARKQPCRRYSSCGRRCAGR